MPELQVKRTMFRPPTAAGVRIDYAGRRMGARVNAASL
jgi:hypothetical protein